MPDGHEVACADCKTRAQSNRMFRIVPPIGREEGGGLPYFICTECWDGIIGAALMSKMRGM